MAITKGQRSKGKGQKLSIENLVSSVKNFQIADKLRNPRVFIPLIIIIIIALLFVFKGLFVVAMVNGKPITRLTLIKELEKKDGQQILSSLIAQTLIFQEADKQHVNVDKKEIDGEIKKTEEALSKEGQNLEQALTLQGLTKEEFIRQITIQKLVNKMLGKTIKVTDKDVNDYIEKNKETLPQEMGLDEIKTSVRQQLEQQQLYTKFQSWLAELQKKAKIQYFVNY